MAPENPFESAFDDEFAVQDPLPADHGSRAADEPRDRAETRATTASQPRPSSDEPAVRRSTSLSPPSDAKRPVVQPPRLVQQRSSIAKNRDLFSPDQQRHSNRDRLSRAVADGTPRQSSDSPRRSSSRASSFAPYDRSGTPLNGPSHPYGMYPQTGVARTASVATSSTIRRPPSTPLPQSSPSHPYALYQQNSLPVSDDDSSVQPLPTIQIGFPGSNAEFHRQLGPDGEEQDIIGPDGHTEQLPPYSKYPNENEKAYVPMAVVPTSPTPSHESQNVLVPPSERQPSHNDRSPSESEGSGTTVAASEKSWKEKNWKERRKTRVCGVFPCWLVMVAFGCLTFVGVVLGGVIGGFLAKEKAKEAAHHNAGGSMIDASAIATPTNAPPFPTGHFSLPLGNPQETNQNCLADPSQLKAWACIMQPSPLFIDTNLAAHGTALAQIYPQPSQGSSISYGPQPPALVPFKILEYVTDLEDPQYGPALHFQTVYNKTVILDPGSLSSSSKKRRQAPGPGAPPGGAFRHRKNTVQAGDQPWFCFWNGTFIEGFIYVRQDIPDNPNTSAASSTTSNGSPQSSTYNSNNQSSHTSTSTTFKTSAITEIAGSFTTSVTSTPSARRQARDNNNVNDDDDNNNNHNGNNGGNGKNGNNGKDNDGPKGMHNNDAENTQQFPLVMKLAERRLRSVAIAPYCQKMVVDSMGGVTPYLQNGAPVKVYLYEVDPSNGAFESAAASPVSGEPPLATDVRKRHLGADAAAALDLDWALRERDLEDRMAADAVAEWRAFDEVEAVAAYWKREDPANSCACQWLVT